MKKIIIALTAVTLGLAASYGIFGFMAKRTFMQGIDEINAKIPSNIEVTYKQGFLSSTIDLKIDVPIQDNDVNADIVVTSSHTIYHGPFVFHSMQNDRPSYIPIQAYAEGSLFYELTGDVDSEAAKAIKAVTTTKMSAYVPLSGNTTILFSGAPLSKEFNIEGETLAVDWQGFNGSMQILGSIQDFTYEFLAPGLSISTNGPEKLVVDTITSSGTAHSGSFDIGLGSYKAGIKSIDITLSADPGDELLLEETNFNVIAAETNGLLTISEIIDIKTCRLANKSYGPANLTVHLRNLDAKSLASMNQAYIDMQKDGNTSSDAMQMKLMEMITTHGATLLSKSPQLDLENISLQTTEGKGELNLKISFNGDGEIVMNPFFLLGRLSAEAKFGADERFLAVLAKDIFKEAMCDDNSDTACDQQAARASSDQLQALISNNQLRLENGRYIAEVSYKDGAATLNGTPMPIF